MPKMASFASTVVKQFYVYLHNKYYLVAGIDICRCLQKDTYLEFQKLNLYGIRITFQITYDDVISISSKQAYI